MRNNMGMGFVFRGVDNLTPVMARMGASFDSTMRKIGVATRDAKGRFQEFNLGARTMATAAAGLVAVQVAASGLGGALDLANEAGKFEQGMAQVAALSDIATNSQEALMLETTAMDAALKTKFSPQQATEGLAQFASQGFTAAEQAGALVPALRLAQAGMISVESSSASMTSALKVFGIQASEAGMVTDKLLKISNATSLGAGDLELALGTVGRGASAAKQNIDEMLIAMGLVKNTGVDASVAASSVSSALIFMANNADDFEKQFGVKVTDANGKFRDFIDVVMDTELQFADKFDDEAERVAASAKLYGKFGLTAFQAVSTQINNGITTATGGIVKGREAVEYLRGMMKNAEGTAAKFEETMLSTFEGQKDLLQGVRDGLRVALGQPFMQLAKDATTNLRLFLEGIVGIVRAIPADVKLVLAKLTVGIFVLVGAIGALVAVRGALILFGMALRFVGLSGMFALKPMLLIGAAVATLGLMFAAFKTRANQLKGGLGGVFEVGRKVALFFRGLVQYLKDGELSGAVLDELNLMENAGVKDFLGTALDVGARIVEFFKGVGEGFAALIADAGPVFVEFQTALGSLGEAVGDFTGGVTGVDKPMAAAQKSGVKWGTMLGQVAVLMIQLMTILLKAITAVVGVFNAFGISIGTVVKAFVAYKVAALAIAAIQLAPMLLSTAGAFSVVGAASGAALGAIAAIKAAMLGLVTLLTGPVGLVLAIGAAVAALVWWADQEFGISDDIANWAADISGLNDELERLDQLNGGRTKYRGFEKEGDPFAGGRTAKLAAEAGMSTEEYQQKRINELQAEGWEAKVNPETGDVEVVGRAKPGGGGPAAGPVPAAGGIPGPPPTAPPMTEQASIDKLAGEVSKLAEQNKALLDRPINVELAVDGEKIATATERGRQAGEARAFRPVTAEG